MIKSDTHTQGLKIYIVSTCIFTEPLTLRICLHDLLIHGHVLLIRSFMIITMLPCYINVLFHFYLVKSWPRKDLFFSLFVIDPCIVDPFSFH